MHSQRQGRFHFEIFMESRGLSGEDRIRVFENEFFLVVLIADGAGGLAGGRQAADFFVAAFQDFIEPIQKKSFPKGLLKKFLEVDQAIASDPTCGECTGVVLVISANGLVGCSVGDSEAWIVHNESITRLTENQQRKPLLGSGMACPNSFQTVRMQGTLVAGTDGLFKYLSQAKIVACLREQSLENSKSLLSSGVRLKSGKLQDDIAFMLCRKTTQ